MANTLSLDEFPSVVPMPPSATVASGSKSARSARSAKPSARAKGASKWGKGDAKAGAEAIAFTGSRSLVFMLGGLAYSELKVARKVMEKESREIVIGSTDFMNPEDFTKALQTLN